MAQGYAYEKHRWSEIRDLPKKDRVAVIPVGCVEQHGPHLPLDTDNVAVGNICLEAAKRAPEDILLLPLIPYGYTEMMMDYPGSISVEAETLTNFLYDIVKSLSRHGFQKAVLVNGHGGNRWVVDTVAMKANCELQISCASVTYWNMIADEIRELRDSEIGGTGHACEVETSLYLYLDASKVHMDKAVKDMGLPKSEFFGRDWTKAGSAMFMTRWPRFSKTGTRGDPTVATAEKGEQWFNAVVEKLVELVREFKAM